ncbi:hypothetical protein [Mycobacterium sp.]|uniref:hypothetical protein n=1 Tax=Mycobacterium sp. TaxID=1785 RepID=UPI003C789ABA
MEDGSDPAGEVVVGAVVPQYPGVAADDLVFEFGEVGGDRPGERVSVGSEIEPAAALDADMPFAR